MAVTPHPLPSSTDISTLLLPPQEGRTTLLVAVTRGHLQSATWLLLNGADVHSMTKTGSALHEAAARKNEAMVELLLLCERWGRWEGTGLFPYVCERWGRRQGAVTCSSPPHRPTHFSPSDGSDPFLATSL